MDRSMTGAMKAASPKTQALAWFVLVMLALAHAPLPAWAQGGAAPKVTIPNFWDPALKGERPALGGQRVVRFLTDDEYPPLHFAGRDGKPTGFMVELARAACEVLNIICTIQTRRFDTLLASLAEGRGDAVAAAIPTTSELRERFGVTLPYHRMPARFVARKDNQEAAAWLDPAVPLATSLAGKRIAVLGQSAHEAFLQAYVPKAVLQPVLGQAAAANAVRSGEADLAFGDGLSLSLWLNGRNADGCCSFVGGPYLDRTYFGEGVGFVVRGEDEALRRALDYALHVLHERGTYAELYLRFFPIGFY